MAVGQPLALSIEEMKILKPLGEIFRFSLHDGFHTAAMQTTTPTPWGRSEALLAVIVTALFSLLVWTTVFGGAQFGPIRELLRSIPASDKVGHFAIYGSIAFFAALLVKQPSRIHLAAVVIGAISFAEEYRQISDFGRTYSLADLVANGLGILAAVWLAKAILRRRQPTIPETPASREVGEDRTPVLR